MVMTPTRAAELVASFSDAMELCLSHRAHVALTTVYVNSEPAIVVTLRDPGTLPEYFDSQRQPVTYVHGSGGGPRVHARWRDCLITWPAPAGAPVEA